MPITNDLGQDDNLLIENDYSFESDSYTNPVGTTMTRAKRSINYIIGWVSIIVIVLLFFELLSFVFFQIPNSKVRSRVYDPPEITSAEFEDYMVKRDPVLGWPGNLGTGGTRRHAGGARISPANNDNKGRAPCISVYGDSFTYGHTVNDEETWANNLARLISCPVQNFGVNGYGVDQAVLSLALNNLDTAPFSILGIFTDDLNRNMNQWRYLLRSPHILFFKPSFRLDKIGATRIDPLPVESYKEFMEISKFPEKYLENEAYYPSDFSSCASRSRIDFPFLIAASKLAINLILCKNLFRNFLSSGDDLPYIPTWFDTKLGPSREKIRRNRIILQYYYGICEERRKACFVLFIPDIETIMNMKETGVDIMELIYSDYPDIMKVWDPTAFMVDNAESANPCNLFGSSDDCDGHYNGHGHYLIACYASKKLSSIREFSSSLGNEC